MYEAVPPSNFAGAADSLDNQYSVADNTLQSLAFQLKDSDKAVKLAAIRALSSHFSLPSNVLQALASQLEDSDKAVKLEAILALSGQSSLPDNVLQVLTSQLKDSSVGIRLAAAEALGTESFILPSNIMHALEYRMRTDPNKDVRFAARVAWRNQVV